MLQETIVNLIRENYPSEWGPIFFNGHILIHLPEIDGDFLQRYRKIKKEITGCVTENFLIREEEVLFEVRNGAWNCSFKIGKTLIP